MRPRIAVCALSGDPEKALANYFSALRDNGGEPVAAAGEAALEGCDGLLLPGGGDIDPGRYGQARLPACGAPDAALDEWQLRALAAFAGAGKPVLGICRGLQVVNVGFGGTLFQHLATAADHRKVGDRDNAHATRVEPGSWLFGIYGEGPTVNSAHHQGVDRLGEGLRAVQWAADGVVEALVHEQLPIFAVQWHPERMRGKGTTLTPLRGTSTGLPGPISLKTVHRTVFRAFDAPFRGGTEGLADGDAVFEDFVRRCGGE